MVLQMGKSSNGVRNGVKLAVRPAGIVLTKVDEAGVVVFSEAQARGVRGDEHEAGLRGGQELRPQAHVVAHKVGRPPAPLYRHPSHRVELKTRIAGNKLLNVHIFDIVLVRMTIMDVSFLVAGFPRKCLKNL